MCIIYQYIDTKYLYSAWFSYPHLTSTSHDWHITRYSHLSRESPSLGYPVAIRASKFLGLRLQLLTSENFNCNDSSTIFHQKKTSSPQGKRPDPNLCSSRPVRKALQHFPITEIGNTSSQPNPPGTHPRYSVVSPGKIPPAHIISASSLPVPCHPKTSVKKLRLLLLEEGSSCRCAFWQSWETQKTRTPKLGASCICWNSQKLKSPAM